LSGGGSCVSKLVPAPQIPEPKDIRAAIDAVRRLREGSKESQGFGYTIEWAARKSRVFGQNQFPNRIVFETREDLLRLINRLREFGVFSAAVTKLRGELPELESWIRSNPQRLIACQSEVEGLVQVVRHLLDNPRPMVFARELPLPVDTKFIERHKRILREWLDIVLAPHEIRSDETHFERRYGLRYAEPHLQLRFLDEQVQQELCIPFSDLSLPLHTLGQLPAKFVRAFIVENRVNLLTFPQQDRGIALGGLGRAVTDLRYVTWLSDAGIWYWGDLDVEGFQILSSLRSLYPQTRSILMDVGTLDEWRHLSVQRTDSKRDTPPHLTEDELSAFYRCRDDNLRVEQERIPQMAICNALKLASRQDDTP
jgi:hypothetical protein